MLKPRRIPPAALRDIDPARVERWTAAQLGLAAADVGLRGSPTVVRGIRADAPQRQRILFEGAGQAGILVDRLASSAAFGDDTGTLDAPPLVRPRRGPCILVVAESAGAAPHRSCGELLAEASRTADALGGHVVALALGGAPHAPTLTAAGADAVLAVDAPATSSATATQVVLCAVRLLQPRAVITTASARGRETLPRVAAALSAGMVGDAIGLELADDGALLAHKPAFGGAVVAPIESRTVPLLATIRPGTCAPFAADISRSAPVESVVVPDLQPETEVIATHVDEGGAPLAGARGVVVCAGHGVGADGVAEVGRFAARLGAVLGASRRVVDSGWLPRSRQIGISGEALVCSLYIGVAVRGAANHLAGLRRARTVVAINHDPRCGLFEAADYALLCNWRDGLRALSDALAERGLLVRV